MVKKHLRQPPVWEWIIACAGLVLVLGAIGTAVYRAATDKGSTPALSVSVHGITRTGDRYVVEYQLENTSAQTAAAVSIEGVLRKGGEVVETSTAAHTYAPANSSRKGGLIFTKDPAQHDLIIRPTGFETP